MKTENNKKKDKAEQFIKWIIKKLNINFFKKNEKLFVQIFKFIIVGGIATIIDFAFLFIFKEFFKLPIVLSNTLSFVISVSYNYIASVKWVFDVDKSKNSKVQFVIFIVLSVIGLGINDLIVWICTDKFLIYYMISKIIATAIVMIFNFITRKLFLE